MVNVTKIYLTVLALGAGAVTGALLPTKVVVVSTIMALTIIAIDFCRWRSWCMGAPNPTVDTKLFVASFGFIIAFLVPLWSAWFIYG